MFQPPALEFDVVSTLTVQMDDVNVAKVILAIPTRYAILNGVSEQIRIF